MLFRIYCQVLYWNQATFLKVSKYMYVCFFIVSASVSLELGKDFCCFFGEMRTIQFAY